MLLAIDSSSVTASAALLSGGTLIAESFLNNGLTHSQSLAPMLDALLKSAGASPGDISQVVVTNGPGSFTGLRIGVATALGFARALGIPCAGVSSLMAAAYGAADTDGTVCAVMDARREQFYCALFSAGKSSLTRLMEDCALSRDELYAKLPPSVLWTGDAAHKAARPGEFAAKRPHPTGYGAALCFLGGEFRSAEEIVYLRLPQAVRERLEADRE